jgi:hypothetical protein
MSNKQLMIINENAFTENDVYQAVDTVIEKLYRTGDLSEATQALNVLDQIGEISAHAKARLLYGMSRWWLETEHPDNFFDYIESMTSRNRRVVVERYVLVQECIEQGKIPELLTELPMRDLIPIANAVSQGYEISDKAAKKILIASSSNEIGAIIRDVKNKPPRKSARTIKLKRDSSLYTYNGTGRGKFLGWLDMETYEKDIDVKEAINRILKAVGIIRE